MAHLAQRYIVVQNSTYSKYWTVPEGATINDFYADGVAGKCQQRITLPKITQDHQSQKCNEYLINENFVRTSVFRGSNSQLQYCDYKNRTLNEHIDLHLLIELYKSFNFTNSYKHTTRNSPIIQSGVLSINDYQELPLFFTADIRRHYIGVNDDSAPRYNVDEQMKLMGQLATDERAYLLPHSLGGARGSNVVPMALNVHRQHAVEYDSYNLVTDKPSSSWWSHGKWIIKFLEAYPDGRVAWKVAVQYAAGVVIDPGRHRGYRPVRFALQYSAYNGTSLFHRSPQTTFVNKKNDPCANNFRPMPSKCRLPIKTSLLHKSEESYS